MSMQELGELFKSARQEAGLSLEDVYERTKISMFVLESLENGDGARLPHPVYAKGFIRSYARLLGLDHEKIIQEYLAAIGPVDDLEIETGVPELHVRRKTKEKSGKFWIFILATAVLVAAAWLVVSYVSREIEPVPPVVMEESAADDTAVSAADSATQDNVDGAADTADRPVVPEDEALVVVDGGETPGLPQVPDSRSVEEETGMPMESGGEEAVVESSDESGNEQEETSAVEVETVVPAAESVETESLAEVTDEPEGVTRAHVLRIEATHDCWIRAIADKETDPDKIVRLLEPGQSVTLSFNRDVELRLGNAGGVRLFVDDAPYAFEGALGAVETVEVTAPAL